MRIRWGYVLLGAIVAAGVLATAAGGSHFRYGNYTWISTGASTVEFSLANGWRRDGYPVCFNTGSPGACSGVDGLPIPGDVIEEGVGGTQFDPGEGDLIGGPGGFGPLHYLVTSVDVANNWLFALALDPAELPGGHDTTIDKTYTTQGNKLAFTDSFARIDENINAPSGQYRVETIVNVGSTNRPPVSAMPPIVNCPTSGVCAFQVPANDVDGDALAYRFSTLAESGIGTQPGPPFAPSAAAISATGLYSWDTTGATLASFGPTYYATQVTIEDRDAQGAVKSKIAVDFLIRLIDAVGTAPTFVSPTPACSSTVTGNVGTALTFTVKASDADQGDSVTLTAAGVPAGATLTPSLPASGNPVETVFSWTPATAGTTIVTFAATDNTGNQALCSLTLAITQAQQAQTPTVSTVIHISNAADDPAPLTGNTAVVPAGTTVHDSATVGGTTNGTPTGTVLFRFYSTADCSDAGTADATPVTVVGGVAHPSANRGPLAVGSFGFRAFYTSNDTSKWNNAESGCEPLQVVSPPAVLLVIDNESIKNGKSGKSKRTELPAFAGNHGGTVTLNTGQTGDEGWFAPTCIPASWLGNGSNGCLTGADRDSAIDNYFGIGTGVPSQNRLDKIPGVMPLRALGIGKLVGKHVCAVVYDSDVSVNYGGSLFTDANLQGETLGVVAFRVDAVSTKKGTLSQVTLTILGTDACGDWQLLNAPVPKSSSVPNDRVAPGSLAGYRQEFTWPMQGLFF